MRQYLTDLGAWNDKKEQKLLDQAAEKVDAAVQEYLNTPVPAPGDMFDYMYEELPEQLEEQRQHAVDYSDSNGGSHG
jgi:pyruvate dehydrogenase E1 component alpha subunit